MDAVLGASLPVFIGLTVVLFGGAAFMMGQAVAGTWRPAWQVVTYGALLALADRFLVFALFGGELLSLTGYLVHAAVLVGIGLLAYRFMRAHKMVSQYPWLYERAGLFGWREKA
ncbi:DUF6867 family protein [Rhodospirillaceae bacterium SYSU D60014]|uniref:DUF6867 family protein n=1 Tax=Virgifigura deserti TaxID=2268457 RepID=UPI000E66E7A4